MACNSVLEPSCLEAVLGLVVTSLVDPCARLGALYTQAFGDAACQADTPRAFATAPGRMELAGNHTDHQGGCVISSAIDSRMYAFVRANGTACARVVMEGFGQAQLDLTDPSWAAPVSGECGTSKALVRGMMAQLCARGVELCGFDMAVVSDVPAGFGVSSSAAFEVLVGASLQTLFVPGSVEGGVLADPVALALAGVEAERAYFGKPCGAQDQIACAVGGVLHMDFSSGAPRVESLTCNFANSGHVACLIDSACDHARYNDQFALIPGEMRAVAEALGADLLGNVEPAVFRAQLPRLRVELGDRPVLRALHYFDENRRVALQRSALEAGCYGRFFDLVNQSGNSSAQFLQNVTPQPVDARASQDAAVVLALCEHVLAGRGAARIHGGGFGGSVLAFVPAVDAAEFSASMNAALGYDACRTVKPGAPGVRAAVLP